MVGLVAVPGIKNNQSDDPRAGQDRLSFPCSWNCRTVCIIAIGLLRGENLKVGTNETLSPFLANFMGIGGVTRIVFLANTVLPRHSTILSQAQLLSSTK